MSRYRRLGADLPFTDLRSAHGVAMEGWYWRFSDRRSGRVIVALCGVCRGPAGPWAAVALAGHPDGLVCEAIARSAHADPSAYAVRADGLLTADQDHVSLALPDGVRLEARLDDQTPWPRRAYGALGPAHWLPGLGQYWHPHLLDGRATGEAQLAGERVSLDGWHVYAEKNWGGGFPTRWWWGQAHGFERDDVCVAFAGGQLPGSPVRASAIVVRIGSDLVRLAPPTAVVTARCSGSEWRLAGRGPRYRVRLVGTATADPHLLPVPLPAEMRTRPYAAQQLSGRLQVEVRRGRELVFKGESALAGLEQGDVVTRDGR